MELETLLVEVEGVINSRPLTYLSCDDDDGVTSITPCHLLHGRNIHTFDKSNWDDKCEKTFTYRSRYLKNLIDKVWRRFFKEYITSLRERIMYDRTKRDETELKLNDIVIIRDDKINPRISWKKGRVTELIHGRDGVVRGALLETITNGKKIVTRRALQRLIPLEVTENSFKYWCPGD